MTKQSRPSIHTSAHQPITLAKPPPPLLLSPQCFAFASDAAAASCASYAAGTCSATVTTGVPCYYYLRQGFQLIPLTLRRLAVAAPPYITFPQQSLPSSILQPALHSYCR